MVIMPIWSLILESSTVVWTFRIPFSSRRVFIDFRVSKCVVFRGFTPIDFDVFDVEIASPETKLSLGDYSSFWISYFSLVCPFLIIVSIDS
jgi:hypothetical protein